MLLLTVALVAGAIRQLLETNRVVVERFAVPQALVNAGMTGDEMRDELVAQIRRIQSEALTRQVAFSLAEPSAQPDVAVPGSPVSLATIVNAGRSVFGLRERRVTAALRQWGDNLQLHIEIGGRSPRMWTSATLPREKIEDLVSAGAQAVLELLDPYTLAVYLFDKDQARAIRLAQDCLVHFPVGQHAWAYNLWGSVLIEQEEYDAAAEKFQRALRLDPKLVQAYVGWGAALARKGRLAEAEDKWRKASHLDRHNSESLVQWGSALASAKDPAAVGKFAEAIERNPRAAHAYFAWGVWLVQSAQPTSPNLSEGIAKLERSIAIDHGYTDGYIWLAKAFLLKRDLDSAESWLLLAHQAGPGRSEPLAMLGEVYMQRGKPDRAADFFGKAVAVDPSDQQAKARLKEAERQAQAAGRAAKAGAVPPTPTPNPCPP